MFFEIGWVGFLGLLFWILVCRFVGTALVVEPLGRQLELSLAVSFLAKAQIGCTLLFLFPIFIAINFSVKITERLGD